MIIDLAAEVYRICGDESRPMLAYVNVERIGPQRGQLIALNGFCAVAVPVTLTPDETVGLIHRSTLERAFKEHRAMKKSYAKREQVELVISESGELINLPVINMQLARWNDANDKEGNYPDIWALIPNAPAKIMRTGQHQSTNNQFALNPVVYYECAIAVGIRAKMWAMDKQAPTFYQVTRTSPFIWAGGGWTETGRPIAPWICMMPTGGLYLDDPYYTPKLAAHLAGATYHGPH